MTDKDRPDKQEPPEPPPLEPDYEAIAYMEGGQGPGDTGKRIFRRDPGAEARRQGRKQAAKKR
jgi:hypothetical protein